MEFSRQESWMSLLSPGDLFHPEIEPRSSGLQADSLLFQPPGKPIISPDFSTTFGIYRPSNAVIVPEIM